jgi:hypothetical protein
MRLVLDRLLEGRIQVLYAPFDRTSERGIVLHSVGNFSIHGCKVLWLSVAVSGTLD